MVSEKGVKVVPNKSISRTERFPGQPGDNYLDTPVYEILHARTLYIPSHNAVFRREGTGGTGGNIEKGSKF